MPNVSPVFHAINAAGVPEVSGAADTEPAPGEPVPLELLARLRDAFPTQFAGIKDSSHDQDFARALGKNFGSDLAVFSGTDSDLTFALKNHAAGCITAPANLLSPGLREIYDAAMQGQDAAVAQERVTAQRHALE